MIKVISLYTIIEKLNINLVITKIFFQNLLICKTFKLKIFLNDCIKISKLFEIIISNFIEFELWKTNNVNSKKKFVNIINYK